MTKINPHYADGSPFSPAVYEPTKEDQVEELKKVRQRLWLGLSIIQDEARKGGDVSAAIDHLKRFALGNQPFQGMTFQEIADFARMIKMMVRHVDPQPMQIVLLKTRIDGKEKIVTEDFGGNVGPVIEPGAEEAKLIIEKTCEAVAEVLTQCKDVREVAHD